jgi:hypothetical protein
MLDRYTEYLDMLKAQGVTLFDNYSYCGNWGQFGNWGSLEYQDQPVSQAPKYAALVQWIAANPVGAVPVSLSATYTADVVRLTYGPVTEGYHYTLQASQNLTGSVWAMPTLSVTQTNGTKIIVTDKNPIEQQRYYRVKVSPP